MGQNNIFSGSSVRAEFINILYQQLMTGNEVSYESVYSQSKYYSEQKMTRSSLSKMSEYVHLKKAFSELIKALNEKESNSIIIRGRRKKTYQYVGSSKDPLCDERQAVVQKSLQDLLFFCKETSGLLPKEWFSHFFKNTQLLLDTINDEKIGRSHIRSSLDQDLYRIELLPVLYRAIVEKHVISFTYHPYGQQARPVIMHPHFLKESNGRWFLLGWAQDNVNRVMTCALDRIEDDPQLVEAEYLPAPIGLYKQYFENIIGVRHEKGSNGCELVLLRTCSLYIHDLILSKKFHHSQKEVKKFDKHKDGEYGEISLEVEINKELIGKILMYGELLRVISPDSLVDTIKNKIKELFSYYFADEMVQNQKEP